MNTQPFTEPIRTAFEFQRATVQFSEDMVEETLRTQQAAMETATRTMEQQRSMQEQTLGQWDQLAAAVERMTEQSIGEDMTDAVSAEEAMDQAETTHEQMWDLLETLTAASMEANDELTAQQHRSIQAMFDALLEAHQQLEEQTVRAVERSVDSDTPQP